MIFETITYTDFNGIERKEDFHFNLTSGEIAELQFENGGFQEYLQRLIDSKNTAEIVKAFKATLKMAYGVKTIDGRNFIKREEDWLAFISSEAYSILLFKLLGDPDFAAAFFNEMVPKDLADRAKAAQAGQGVVVTPRAPQDHLQKQTAVKEPTIETVYENDSALAEVPVNTLETREQMEARIRAEILAESTGAAPSPATGSALDQLVQNTPATDNQN